MTATSSYPIPSTHAERGRPMFPQAVLLMPAARRISSIIVTVVVLPLVPVTATSAARRYMHPSSDSPMMRLPALRKATGSSWSMGMPGLNTSTSQSAAAFGKSSVRTASAPRAFSFSIAASTAPSATSSYIYTAAPRESRNSAPAMPLLDMPATKNF